MQCRRPLAATWLCVALVATPSAAAPPEPPAQQPSAATKLLGRIRQVSDRVLRAKAPRGGPKGGGVAPPAVEPKEIDELLEDARAVFDEGARSHYLPGEEALRATVTAARDRANREATLEAQGALDEAYRDYADATERAVRRLQRDLNGSAVVVSGGISLGAYEAGLLYYYTLIQARWAASSRAAAAAPAPGGHTAPDRFDVATGASAGAINAFLAAIASCKEPVSNPVDSPFWSWTEIDWSDLVDAPETNECKPSFGVLGRRSLRTKMVHKLKEVWEKSTWVPCDVSFGLTVSNLKPRKVPLVGPTAGRGATADVSRLTERFAFRMHGNGAGPPTITALDGAAVGVKEDLQPVLGNSGGEKPRVVTFEQVIPLLLASSGIPGVFDPIRVEFTVDGEKKNECFVDGGVLDNVPLSAAMKLVRAQRDERARSARGGAASDDEGPTYFYVNPDILDPKRPPPGEKWGLFPFLGGVVTGSRQAELVRTIEDDEGIRARLILSGRKHLITGELLGAFGAFMDESFRTFDFFAGMADAREYLRWSPAFSALQAEGLVGVDAPEFACFARAWEDRTSAVSSPECLALAVEGGGRVGKLRRDLYRLIQAAFAVEGDMSDVPLDRKFFAALAHPVAFPGAARSATSGFEYLTLTHRGEAAGPRHGLEAVREQVQRPVDELAARTPLYARALVSTPLRSALDGALGFASVSSAWWLGVMGHGPEFGLSRNVAVSPAGVREDGDREHAFALGLVGSAWLADVLIAPGRDWIRAADSRLHLGLKGEWAPRWIPANALQLQLAISAAGQAIHDAKQTPVYRAGLGFRADLQLAQRFYLSINVDHFGRETDSKVRTDLAFGFGFRIW